MVRKADLIKLCEMLLDCEFISFTNRTLIDKDSCEEMLRGKNFVSAISVPIRQKRKVIRLNSQPRKEWLR